MKLYRINQLASLIAELRLKPKSCVAFVFCEDTSLIDETLEFLQMRNFSQIFQFICEPEQYRIGENIHNIRYELTCKSVIWSIIRSALPSLRGKWLYWGLNGEFFFYPYCESRTVADLADFLEAERRESIFGTTIDLYAGDLALSSDGVDMENTYFDLVNYYAHEPHYENGEEVDPEELERIKFIVGGLRWRFAELMPYTNWLAHRRVDRVPFFYVSDDLSFDENGFTKKPEFYTYKAPNHYSPTSAIASFHVARYLRHNHDMRQRVPKLKWDGSQSFNWTSAQLLRTGFIETGQWF